MKKIYYSIAILLSLITIISCEKNGVQDIASNDIGAQVKFFNFAPNLPTVNFFANTAKISATLSTSGKVSTTGVSYGSVFPSTNYASLAPAAYTFTGQIPESSTVDPSLAVTTLQGTVEKGKYYSIYSAGIYNATTKTAESFILEDMLPAIDTGFAYVRFVNAISNANPIQFVVGLANTTVEANLGNPVAYKQGSAFVKVPEAVYNLYGRYPNSATNTISRALVSFLRGRVYTISARGDITVTLSTAANRPVFDNTTNR